MTSRVHARCRSVTSDIPAVTYARLLEERTSRQPQVRGAVAFPVAGIRLATTPASRVVRRPSTAMKHRGLSTVAAAFAALIALSASAEAAQRGVGSTAQRPPVPLDSTAMNAMLRADRDKDGTLTREELDRYDLGLGRRFRDVDADRDGRLTLYEFEKLLSPAPQ